MAKSAGVERVKPEFKIDEDLPNHIRAWKFQKVLWVLLFIVLLLSLAGFFGNGPLSKREEASQEIKIEYDYFLRNEASSSIWVQVQGNQPITIRISQQYLKKINLEGIVPEPGESFFSGNDVVYQFFSDMNAGIRFHFQPEAIGSLSGRLMVNNTAYSLKHFIYP